MNHPDPAVTVIQRPNLTGRTSTANGHNGHPRPMQNPAAAAQTREAEQAELDQKIEEIRARRIQLYEEEEQEKAAERTKRLQSRDDLQAKAEQFRQEARRATDPAERRQLYEYATEAQEGANALTRELFGDTLPADRTPEPETGLLAYVKRKLGFGTSRAISLTFVAFVFMCVLVGVALLLASEDPDNASAQVMSHTTWLRVLVNIPLTLGILLLGVGYLRVFFPDQYRYWHTEISQEYNLIDDLNASQPWLRVLFFAFVFALPIWVFLSALGVIFV